MTISVERMVALAVGLCLGFGLGLGLAGVTYGDPQHILLHIWLFQVFAIALFTWGLWKARS